MSTTATAGQNFFRQFCDADKKLKKLTATQFAEVWNHYDKDGNGFIEGEELDIFLQQFSTLAVEGDADKMTKEALDKLREEFLTKYDENKDRKIEISELANILPEDENFLLLFRRASMIKSSQQFMKIWKQFDNNHNGYIDASELEKFLEQLIAETKDEKAKAIDKTKLTEYALSIIKLFDKNKDGKLQLSELAKLLPTEENYLSKPFVKTSGTISAADIDRVFDHYDKDGNGTIEDEELEGFMKDFLELMKETYTIEDLEKYKKVILSEWDVNHDGKISRDELKMILMQHQKAASLRV